MTGDRLDEAVRAVGQFLVADAPLGATLERIAVLARDSIGETKAVGITLIDDRRRPTTAVFTDELPPAVDRGQYEEGRGPCLDAFREGRVVRVDDARAVRDTWSGFSRSAVECGVLSTLSVPLGAAGQSFGVLNLYAAAERAFTEADERDAALFATQASAVLANAQAYRDAVELAEGLRQAMESRAVIEQAKGKIMATNRCTPDEAFAILVRASQRENVKVREVARRLVEGGPPGEEPARD